MAGARGDSEQTKAAIIEAARDLFAERGVKAVRVRDIAAQAGVTHALVHRYFGSKEDIVGEILRREVSMMSKAATEPGEHPEDFGTLVGLRELIRHALFDMEKTILLITRAELSGLKPEQMLEGRGRLLGLLRDWIAGQQATCGKDPATLPDPALASATIGAAIFALVTLNPWLMTAVGMEPDDYESRREEIVDVIVGMAAHATGADR
jgi:AcrR family transcriptional regulator